VLALMFDALTLGFLGMFLVTVYRAATGPPSPS
jgi:hypothetical protein